MKTEIIILFFFSLTLSFNCRSTLPQYTIDLDLPAGKRFEKVNTDLKEVILKIKTAILSSFSPTLKSVYSFLFSLRNEDMELEEELKGLSEVVEIPVSEARLLSLIYEFTTLSLSTNAQNDYKMCLGMVAKTKEGVIYHGRNLDLGIVDLLKPALYDAVFTKQGKKLFTAQMIAGYHGTVSGLKDGMFGLSEATRDYTTTTDSLQVIWNIVRGKTQATWNMRKVLENCNTYACAYEKLSNESITAPIYYILSGLDDGVVITRNPESVANVRKLSEVEKTTGESFIIQANYDTFIEDPREKNDPRRFIAEDFIRGKEITQELVFQTIDKEGVKLEITFWQGEYSAKTGYWNSTIPN